MILKIRNPKTGRFTKAPPERTINALDTFGQSLVKRGKTILERSNKVASGTLIDSYHYKLIPTKTGFELQFGFGSASKYWRYIDEGVQGVGGYKGSGGARGGNSPFKFKYEKPGGKLVEALQSWFDYKGVSTPSGMTRLGFAFAIGYSIKRRGLERTMFFSRPLEALYNKMTEKVTKAYADDVENLINKMDTVIAELKSDLSNV